MEKASLVHNGSPPFIGTLYFLSAPPAPSPMAWGNLWHWACKYFFNGADKILNASDGNSKEANNKKLVLHMGRRYKIDSSTNKLQLR